ncbi:hypothetical protein V0288_14710 [Pannus brasiliensis CCIBt3594]|uniref:Uncharacterized protein n=1 Tax=Pannus brasiliensis CCIBt3594 TaxID=1427578 RepID=A0AAW9QTJ9_9CHRO
MRLGEILVKNHAISSEQLAEGIRLQESQSKRLGEILIERGLVPEEEIESALQEQYWRRNGFWVLEERDLLADQGLSCRVKARAL